MDFVSEAVIQNDVSASDEASTADAYPLATRAARWWEVWPALFAIALFLAIVWHHAHLAILYNDGRLTYPIDDAYGHLAIAKNLYRHGTWGFSYLNGFSSGESSLIWPVLVAGCFALFGVHDYTLFVMNLVISAVLLIYVAAIIRRYTANGWLNVLISCAVVYLAPLPAVAASGMEHCLQILFDLAFIDIAIRTLAVEIPAAGRLSRYGLPLFACLMVVTRYEGLFIVAVVGFLFLCRGWWRQAFIFGVASAVVPTVFGCYSLYKGWYFLPNSLLLKGNTAPLSFSVAGLLAYFERGYVQLMLNPHVIYLALAMMAALVATIRRHRTFWSPPVLLLTITLTVMAIHVQYAAFGWFFRYEAYLIAYGLLALGICLAEAGPPPRAAWPDDGTLSRPILFRRRAAGLLPYFASIALAAGCFGYHLIHRANESMRMWPIACHDIYQQQFQMGMFLRRFYQGRGVVANDIGAISYFSDIRLFDIYGLADIDALRAKRAGAYNQQVVERAIKKYDARVVIVYDGWANEYGGQLPDWVPVGQWTIFDNLICGGPTVTFYATKAEYAPELMQALKSYSPRLPKTIGQHGLYLGEHVAPDQVGGYRIEYGPNGRFQWTARGVQFYQYPFEGRPDSEQEQNATVHVQILPTPACTGVDIFINGELQESHDYPANHDQDWMSYDITTRAQMGLNTVRLLGRGTAVRPPTDGRHLLFGTRPPTWAPAPPVTVPPPATEKNPEALPANTPSAENAPSPAGTDTMEKALPPPEATPAVSEPSPPPEATPAAEVMPSPATMPDPSKKDE